MKHEIYQLKEDTMEQMKLRFMAFDQAAQLGGIRRENYRLVYEGNVETRKDAQQTLDGLFRRFFPLYKRGPRHNSAVVCFRLAWRHFSVRPLAVGTNNRSSR